MKAAKGFTLIELMVVVAIIAIIAAVAIPSYNDYVRQGKLTEAFGTLSDYRVRMEQYNVDNRNYGAAGGDCGPAVPSGSNFTYTCVAGTPASTYVATATSNVNVGLGTAGDYVYTIDDAGAKNTSAYAGGAGTAGEWRRK